MKFGLWLAAQYGIDEPISQRLDECAEQVRLARDVGFDGVFAGERYLGAPFRFVNGLLLLARLCPEARGMDVGTSAVLLPLHNPARLAEEIATLDALSHGRFIAGVALGYREVEFAAFGVAQDQRLRRLLGNLAVVRALLRGEAVTFERADCVLRDVTLLNRPVQEPHPPFWVGGNNVQAARRAAVRAEGLALSGRSTLGTIRELVAAYRARCAELGRAPGAIAMNREVYVAADRATAWRDARPALEEKYRTVVGWGQDRILPEADKMDVPFEQLVQGRFVVGDPDDCVAELTRYADAGVGYPIVRFQWPGLPHERVLEAISLFGREVVPRLRAC